MSLKNWAKAALGVIGLLAFQWLIDEMSCAMAAATIGGAAIAFAIWDWYHCKTVAYAQ